jgi:hypothetical protein
VPLGQGHPGRQATSSQASWRRRGPLRGQAGACLFWRAAPPGDRCRASRLPPRTLPLLMHPFSAHATRRRGASAEKGCVTAQDHSEKHTPVASATVRCFPHRSRRPPGLDPSPGGARSPIRCARGGPDSRERTRTAITSWQRPVITGWARFPTPGVGFRADPLIMAPDGAIAPLSGPHDRRFGAFSCCFRPVSRRSLDHVRRHRLRWRRAPEGQAPGPAREAGR